MFINQKRPCPPSPPSLTVVYWTLCLSLLYNQLLSNLVMERSSQCLSFIFILGTKKFNFLTLFCSKLLKEAQSKDLKCWQDFPTVCAENSETSLSPVSSPPCIVAWHGGPNGSFKAHSSLQQRGATISSHKTYDTSDVFVMKFRENAVN